MQKLKQQQLFDRVFDRLPDHVTLLLIIISGFLLARLTWMMFPSDPSLIAETPVEQEAQGVSVIKAHARSTDLGKEIAGYHLLGVYKPPAPVKKAAPPKPVKVVAAPKPEPKKPRPPLKLVGVYSLSGKSSIAIINVKGKQQVVGLNEAIGDSGAILTKVSAESIEVSWDGDIQTLKMPNIGKTAISAIQLPASQQPQAQPAVQQPIVQTAALRTQNQQNPAANQQQNKIDASTTSAGNRTAAPAKPASGAAQPTVPLLQGSNNNSSAQQNPAINSGAGSSAAGTNGATPRLADFRQQIMNNNINLLKVIRPSPKKENGKLIGFRIRPGTNRALFQQTGLKSGDVVTQVNGMPLTSNASSMQAMQTLSSSSGANLTVIRGGQTTSVQVNF